MEILKSNDIVLLFSISQLSQYYLKKLSFMQVLNSL